MWSSQGKKKKLKWNEKTPVQTVRRYLKMIVHRMNLAGMVDSDFHLVYYTAVFSVTTLKTAV